MVHGAIEKIKLEIYKLVRSLSTRLVFILRTNATRFYRGTFWDKLISLKKLFNIWSQRDISVYGTINLVKSLALSKLVFICSVMETPKLFVDEVNKIVLDFIWGHKPPKIKYTTLIKTRQEGGLEMKDFSLFNKA